MVEVLQLRNRCNKVDKLDKQTGQTKWALKDQLGLLGLESVGAVVHLDLFVTDVLIQLQSGSRLVPVTTVGGGSRGAERGTLTPSGFEGGTPEPLV